MINCAAEGTNSQCYRRRVIVGNPCWRLECPQVSSTGLLKALEFKANRRAENASRQECRLFSFMFSMQALLNPPSRVLPWGLDGEIIPFSLWSIPVLRVKRGTLGHCFLGFHISVGSSGLSYCYQRWNGNKFKWQFLSWGQLGCVTITVHHWCVMFLHMSLRNLSLHQRWRPTCVLAFLSLLQIIILVFFCLRSLKLQLLELL